MATPLRSLATFALVVVLGAVSAIACVPSPVGRASAPPASAGPVTASPVIASPTPSGPTPPPSFVRPTPTALPTFLVYVVASGDTLSSIARQFQTNPFSLAVWNRDTHPSLDPESEGYRPDLIQVGWALRIIPGIELDEEVLLEPTPSPRSTPAPASPGASPTTGGGATQPPTASAATVVHHGPRSVKTVALTFDMGGRLDPALDIVAWLADHDVPATIFPTGKTGTTTAEGIAALEAVADRPDLFDLGNHSWSHPDFRDLSDAAMREQLEETESAVLATINRSTKPWFRPPFGGLDDQVPAVVGSLGWSHVVMWDVDTIDWRPESDGGPTTEQIVDKVVGNAQGGSIVLMHLGGFNTLEALPGIIDGLRAKGLRPVTLGEMFGTDG